MDIFEYTPHRYLADEIFAIVKRGKVSTQESLAVLDLVKARLSILEGMSERLNRECRGRGSVAGSPEIVSAGSFR